MADEHSSPSRLNGNKPILIAVVGLLLPVVAVQITIWADVRQLKEDRAARVSGERIAKIEGEVSALDAKVDRNYLDLKRVDEDSRRDREFLHQQIERYRQR